MSQPACISTHMMRENASSGPTLRRGIPRISGQGQSWYLMALADCCSILPRGSEDWQYLAGLWKEAMEGMLRYQDQESGLFFQLTALGKTPGNYLETSASAMAAYSIYKGYEMGIFNRQTVHQADLYHDGSGDREAEAQKRMLHLEGTCAGAGLGPADRPERGWKCFLLSGRSSCLR